MRRALAPIVLAVVACGPPAVVPTPSAPTSAPPAQSAVPSAGPGSGASDWPTYHHDLARTGMAAAVGSFTTVERAWQTDVLDGDVYAEPIVVGGRTIVATERNVVYAFDTRSGAQQWKTILGDPVPANSLPCGNIRPVSGITGTPVADAQADLLYVVAFLQAPAPHHELHAIELASGRVRFHRGIDPPGADPRVHQQRAALAVANGDVYVAFGGLFGDCGPYHGWVVAAKLGGAGGDLVTYQVPTRREGGIWAPSGIAVDAAGHLYVATGNSDTTGSFDQNDAVLRLSADLKVEDFWAPADWLALSRADIDIGSVGPTLVADGLLVAGGKNGVVYLLATERLGQIGGEISQLKVCGGIYGGFAYADGALYVPCTDGLAAVRVADRNLSALWRGPRTANGSPIFAGGAVWVTDNNAGVLYGLDPGTGRIRTQESLGAMQHFTTPSAFADLILVAAGGRLVARRLR